jgi:hypothetical protein
MQPHHDELRRALESSSTGEPAKLIRHRYREVADIIRKGKMCDLFINDLDAGARRMGGTMQSVHGERDADEHRGQPHERAAAGAVQQGREPSIGCILLSSATTSAHCTRHPR